MLRFLKLYTFILLLNLYHVSFASHEISEIYVSSTGNNKYESEIKAISQGRNRALMLILSQLSISPNDVEHIPYFKLKDVFHVSATKNVISTDSNYKATITYQYNFYDLYQLLMDYGNKNVHDKFYEYLVIPISKQNNLLKIWDSKEEWHKKWDNSRIILEQSKILYPKATEDIKFKINNNNVLGLSYHDYLDLFPGILIKKVMLIICEYFTDINSRDTIMLVKYIILDNENKTVINKEYNLNSFYAVKQEAEKLFIDTVSTYGRFSNEEDRIALLNFNPENQKTVELKTIKLIDDDSRNIIFDLEAFNSEEISEIQDKLSKVQNIQDYKIEHVYEEKYKVTITTKLNDYELAENLYVQKLSFKRYNNLYSLINVINSGR